MIDIDTIPIYQKEGFSNLRQEGGGRRPSPLDFAGSSILVRPFTLEGNNYRFSFDYFIDFSDKARIVWEETSLSLSMAILTIFIVVNYIYYYLQEPYGREEALKSKD